MEKHLFIDKSIVHLLLFLLVVGIVGVSCMLQCFDEDNTPVDWFVVYKLPRIKKSDNELIQTGHAYTYITSKNVSSGWKLSTHSINDTTSIAGQTLKSLYDNGTKQDPGTLWILYNDQPPNGGVEIELGHTKGVVMSQSNGGFWLIHSVPHYPPSPNKSTHNAYSYPHTGLHYGQSLMCISLDAKQLDTVGIQLMYNEPEIYSVNTLGVLGNLFPNLMAAANNTRVQSAPWFHQAQINSLQGTKFSSFAKASHFHKDLYADWVAAALETDLVVESWTNGVGPMPSECSKQFKVENIQSVNVKVAAANFSSHLDHSKWALSVNNLTKSWVCVGDINRMTSQEERGGGTVCINNGMLWSAYRGVVASLSPCHANTTQT